MISAATSKSGRVAQGSNQAASRKAMARHMLAAVSSAWIPRRMSPVRRVAVLPLSEVTTLKATAVVVWRATNAAAAATQPKRLTGLCVPRSSR